MLYFWGFLIVGHNFCLDLDLTFILLYVLGFKKNAVNLGIFIQNVDGVLCKFGEFGQINWGYRDFLTL